jgi:rhodanese-related sulfurtransferase
LLLLDCREAEEVAAASIDGATHIPMGDVPARLQELDPETPVIVFCHHGIRSQSVAHFLRQQDFDEVLNMTGGIDAWSRKIDPDVPRYE